MIVQSDPLMSYR
ncbi:BgTH12-07534 [Blumeria graminis f. sp. triticale]|uniref:BgTH12-07534 n=1 Tax=Blumeria graminis f. sp. triticale TaxID=1689686 RepID=A0A9W4D1S6_BLUGR|nr:BgTH12-07534 [Blumeria graminis f. sp. triticale]